MITRLPGGLSLPVSACLCLSESNYFHPHPCVWVSVSRFALQALRYTPPPTSFSTTTRPMFFLSPSAPFSPLSAFAWLSPFTPAFLCPLSSLFLPLPFFLSPSHISFYRPRLLSCFPAFFPPRFPLPCCFLFSTLFPSSLYRFSFSLSSPLVSLKSSSKYVIFSCSSSYPANPLYPFWPVNLVKPFFFPSPSLYLSRSFTKPRMCPVRLKLLYRDCLNYDISGACVPCRREPPTNFTEQSFTLLQQSATSFAWSKSLASLLLQH